MEYSLSGQSITPGDLSKTQLQMQGIDRVNHPTQMQTQTQASTQVIKTFSSS